VQGLRHRLHVETPIGTFMVSSEGACNAHHNFGRLQRKAAVSLGRA